MSLRVWGKHSQPCQENNCFSPCSFASMSNKFVLGSCPRVMVLKKLSETTHQQRSCPAVRCWNWSQADCQSFPWQRPMLFSTAGYCMVLLSRSMSWSMFTGHIMISFQSHCGHCTTLCLVLPLSFWGFRKTSCPKVQVGKKLFNCKCDSWQG